MHSLERSSYGLNVPQEEKQEDDCPEDTRHAIELFYRYHHRLRRVIRQSPRHIVGNAMTQEISIDTRAYGLAHTRAHKTYHRQSHEELREGHQVI